MKKKNLFVKIKKSTKIQKSGLFKFKFLFGPTKKKKKINKQTNRGRGAFTNFLFSPVAKFAHLWQWPVCSVDSNFKVPHDCILMSTHNII